MSTPFKHALIDHDKPAWKVGLRTNIPEVRISKIASGRAVPRDWEKFKLAEELEKPVQELFPEPHTEATA